MHYGLKTCAITVTADDEQHVLTGLVTVNNTSEDTGTYDTMTETNSLTIHVTKPDTPPEIVGGELEYQGKPYRVTSIKPPVSPGNRVMFNPFKWSFNAKQVQY